MESKNLSSLIQLSVSDGQKTDSSIDVSFIQAIGGCTYATVFSSKKWRKMKTRILIGWRTTVMTL